MNFLPLCVTLLSLSIAALPLSATTLSVVPLADSLQNPELVDTKSEVFDDAFKAVTDQMLNQPTDEAELETARKRISRLAQYRDTRVGKLFFGALAATPDVENLPESATFAAINNTWPLALGSLIRVRVEWSVHKGEWRISALEVTLDGVAAAPITGMAPYFGNGEMRPALLDFEPIDYLVGRNPADREKPESERPAFDYGEAIAGLFESEQSAFKSTVKSLKESVTSSVERKDRLVALKPHLATDEEFQAAKAADADPERRSAFWEEIYKQIESALNAPRPASVPKGQGAEVRVRYRLAESGGSIEGTVSAIRLESGKIAPRGERSSGKDTPDGDEGNGSGD